MDKSDNLVSARLNLEFGTIVDNERRSEIILVLLLTVIHICSMLSKIMEGGE